MLCSGWGDLHELKKSSPKRLNSPWPARRSVDQQRPQIFDLQGEERWLERDPSHPPRDRADEYGGRGQLIVRRHAAGKDLQSLRLQRWWGPGGHRPLAGLGKTF